MERCLQIIGESAPVRWIALAQKHNAWEHFCTKIEHRRGITDKGLKGSPPNRLRRLASISWPPDVDLIKDMKQAGIADDKSASECLEIAARKWLARRVSKGESRDYNEYIRPAPGHVGAGLGMLCSEQSILSIDGTASGYALGAISAAAEDEMANQKARPRYRADITAGSLKVPESRRIADLLLHEVDADDWTDAIVKRNILQARTQRRRSGSQDS